MDFQVSIIGIILILAFYLLGYFFRKLYFSGFSTKQFGMGEWYDRFFLSIFFGIIIQFITINILKENFQFNFNSISEPVTLCQILIFQILVMQFFTCLFQCFWRFIWFSRA